MKSLLQGLLQRNFTISLLSLFLAFKIAFEFNRRIKEKLREYEKKLLLPFVRVRITVLRKIDLLSNQ
jgi:hypothetical protein